MYMKTTSSEHVVYINCFECQNKHKKTIYVHVLNLQFPCKYWTGKSMNNLLSYCGLIDAKISASEKDLPVPCRKIKQRKFREKFRRIRNRENM